MRGSTCAADTAPAIGLAELCMGGLGHIRYAQLEIGGLPIPGVEVWTDHPAVSCMASQYAGWALTVGKYFAMASGPLRAHARVEKELFEKLGYAETAARGVLVLEGRTDSHRRSRRTRRAEVVALTIADHVRDRAHCESRGRSAGRRPHPRDRTAQDGSARLAT